MASRTAKQQVTEYCTWKGLLLCNPSRSAPEILIYDYKTGFGRCIVEAQTWEEAMNQLVEIRNANY